MKIKVYLYEIDCGYVESSLVFASKEFGWMEYYDNYDTHSPLVFKSKKDMIENSYNGTDKQAIFEKYGKLTYLGEL